MRIGSKVAVGFALLIALMLAIQLYHVFLIHEMREIEQDLMNVDFASVQGGFQLKHDLNEFGEWITKYIVTGDGVSYGMHLKSMREFVEKDIQKLTSLRLKTGRTLELERLQSLWSNSTPLFDKVQEAYNENDPGRVLDLLEPVGSAFDKLIPEIDSVIAASEASIREQLMESHEKSRRTEWVSWGAVLIAVGIGAIVSLLVIRSIVNALDEITIGTRRIARGDFSVSVDESGQDELAELARNFNKMVRRLDELDELKRDFVSHVSHELKAPLASIQETTKLLLEGIPGQLNEKQQRLLGLTLRSGKRLSAMISNLLDLSIIEAGAMQYNFEIKNIVGIANRVVEDYAGLYLEKHLAVKSRFPQEPILIKCDENRMIQVVGNLIANAVSFSEEEGAISIDVTRYDRLPDSIPNWAVRDTLPEGAGRLCLISVIDEGPGVPDDHKERIFEKFHEVKQGKKISGQGTGLGLAISRSIVYAHGGTIWVDDNEGRGSRFHVLLPALRGV